MAEILSNNHDDVPKKESNNQNITSLSNSNISIRWNKKILLKNEGVKDVVKETNNKVNEIFPKNKLDNIKFINGELILDNFEELLKLSEKELTDNILDTVNKVRESWQKIEFINFWKNYPLLLKEKINHIIWLNNPLLNISRLNPWHNVVDITFLWVKDLNDNISKEFVDLFNLKLKEKIKNNFDANADKEKIKNKLVPDKDKNIDWRIVRSDYKHITISLPESNNISKALFWNEINREKFIKDTFDNISDEEIKESMLNASKQLSREEIKDKLLDEFDFWVWISKVPWKKWDKLDNKIKLESFYKAEISSRVKPEWKDIKLINYNFDKIKEFTNEVFKLEKEIIEKYDWKQFTLDWIDYNIVTEISNWEKVISGELLRYIRKWKDIWNDALNDSVKNYLDNLNNWYDFISPVINKSDYKKINNIDEAIKDWKIDVSYFEKNYKWTLTKEAIEKASNWKDWMRIFVDIVDMWIMNLVDFKDRAKLLQSWDIKPDDIKKLTEAWSTVTGKFQRFVKEIGKIPWAKLSLGWDEVFIFIEWKTRKETAEVMNNITKELSSEWLRWRVSYSFDKATEWIFDNLDSLTKINKIIEKKIEENIIWKKLDIKVPNNLTVDIDPKIIWTKEWAFDNFLKKMENNISDDKIYELLNNSSGWKKRIGEIFWKDIILFKKSDGEFLLKIK